MNSTTIRSKAINNASKSDHPHKEICTAVRETKVQHERPREEYSTNRQEIEIQYTQRKAHNNDEKKRTKKIQSTCRFKTIDTEWRKSETRRKFHKKYYQLNEMNGHGISRQ